MRGRISECVSGVALVAVCAAVGVGCKKTGEEPPSSPAATGTPAAPAVAANVIDKIGVKPGPVRPPQNAGAAAVLSSKAGGIAIRPVGTDTFGPAGDKAKLQAGDVIRTDAKGRATIALADGSVVELAEDTAIAIGDRQASADPASSIAVLYGVARVSVSPRGGGEGAFLAFVAPGVAAAKGTVFTAAVAASGQARVGVEAGSVDVAGAGALTAPVSVPAGQVIVIGVDGSIGKPEAIAKDDWAAWRFSAEGSLEARAAAELQAARLTALEARIDRAFDRLRALAQASVQAVGEADKQATANASAEYKASAEVRASTIEATFLVSLELERLVYALNAHAYMLGEIYARNPDAVGVVYTGAAPQVQGAILYEKKFHTIAYVHLAPLRTAYYIHTPAGRLQAAAVGQVVPDFFAKVELPPVPPASISARAEMAVYVPPRIEAHAQGKAALAVPAPNWHANLEAKAAPYAHGAWAAPAPNLHGKLVAGLVARAELKPMFPAMPSASAYDEVGVRFEVPKMTTGATFAAHGQIKAAAAQAANVGGGVGIGGDVRAGAHVEPPSAKFKASAKARVDTAGAEAKAAGAEAKGRVAAGVDATMKGAASVKAAVPPPPPPPSAGAGAKFEMKGGFKVGGGAKAEGAAGSQGEAKNEAKAETKDEAKGEAGGEAKGGFKVGSKVKLGVGQ